uniref:Uncharacterized protein n=1 Tax=Opuntia streptacantha TaxID=393608 RepID=A0A7C9EJ64_OPUST
MVRSCSGAIEDCFRKGNVVNISVTVNFSYGSDGRGKSGTVMANHPQKIHEYCFLDTKVLLKTRRLHKAGYQDQQCLVIRIDVLQENSPVQSLLLYLWIFSQNLTHVSYDIINLVDIQMTNSKMGLDAPMSFLAQISDNTNCEFMVRNIECFTIITSDYCR